MNYNLNLIIQTLLSITQMIFDVGIVWFVIYYAIKIIRNNSRTIQIFKGIVVVIIVDFLAKLLGLSTVSYISSMFLSWGFLIIVIIFQPEIRNMLEKLGKSNILSTTNNLSSSEKDKMIDDLVKSCVTLSSNNTGALISIEQNQSLMDYIKTGVALESNINPELLTSIFITTTPLHDGAVIIKGDKIMCASAYFPPTNLMLSTKFGARHRAAIGISEISDCITIVVSEETGEISIAKNGNLQLVAASQLRETLKKLLYDSEVEVRFTNLNSDNDSKIYTLEDKTIDVIPNAPKKVEESKDKPKEKNKAITASEIVKINSTKKPKKGLLPGIFKRRKKETPQNKGGEIDNSKIIKSSSSLSKSTGVSEEDKEKGKAIIKRRVETNKETKSKLQTRYGQQSQPDNNESNINQINFSKFAEDRDFDSIIAMIEDDKPKFSNVFDKDEVKTTPNNKKKETE